MTTDYRPIACGAYDEIEVMAMHRAEVELVYLDDAEARHSCTGRIVDTAIHGGAEYLVLESQGERLEFRLDRIVRIDERGSGNRWCQNNA